MSRRPSPWLALYGADVPAAFAPQCRNAIDLFQRGVRTTPDAPAIHYFDTTITYRDEADIAEALAHGLRTDLDARPGDRIGLMLQNVPQTVIAVHAAFLAGLVVTPINPMYKHRELHHLVGDAGIRIVLCHEPESALVASLRGQSPLEHVLTVSELDYLDAVPALLAGHRRGAAAGTIPFLDLVARHHGSRVERADPAPDDVAMLTYTSGTTGTPKGAMNTHRGLVANAETFCRWTSLDATDVTVGMAPLFHITGFVAHLAAARFATSPLILTYRFDAAELIRQIQRRRGSWMIGPLTAYLALLDCPLLATSDLSSLTKVASGGAPVAAAAVDRYEAVTGTYIANMYGLTEATSVTHAVPFGARAPVDEQTGALSIGVPVCGCDARVVSLEDGSDLPDHEIGELLVRGPAIVPGYWNKPEESAHMLRDGWLHTGDVGKRDEQGWFFLIDRAKDMISVSGFKVWPRDVEDVLYQHPAVHEACVVGVPDDYRGERVKAFVVLVPGAEPAPTELIEHCRRLLAVYKCPREIAIVTDLPKTASGKIMRRQLRERERDVTAR